MKILVNGISYLADVLKFSYLSVLSMLILGLGVFFVVVGQAGFQLCVKSVLGILCCALKEAKSSS